MCLKFSLHSPDVMSGSEMTMLVCFLLRKIVAFMFLGGSECAFHVKGGVLFESFV